jgi:RNAse (barnase) inhibitor barstar
MSLEKAPFQFPPVSRGEWRGLDEDGRRQWLDCAHHRFFYDCSEVAPSKSPGRVVVLDGSIVDDLLGFYCAIGEAVNGPGGYFGRSMHGFDDCLFSGFGLECPYTIVWKESERSKRALGSQALLRFLTAECGRRPSSEWSEEGKAWFQKTKEAALEGERSMFDEIIEAMESVTSRGGGEVTLVLA